MNGQTILRQQQTALCGHALPARGSVRPGPARRCALTVKAEQEQGVDRRAAMGLLAGVASLITAQPSRAAFGDSANIFGKATNTSGLIPYQGEGFSVELPSKWTPSKEREVPNVVLRYEDTGDQVNSVIIFKAKGGGGSLGDPSAFLKTNAYLFGENVWKGATISEGGFKKDQVSAANLLNSTQDQKNGKTYYKYEVLTRAADGNEGGRHNLIVATTGGAGGDLWVCKVTIGDKRWFKGANKSAKSIYDSFTVA